MRWPTNQQSSSSSLSHYYRSLLRIHAKSTSLIQGTKLHATLFKNGISASPNSFLHNALLHLYALCGQSSSARKVFDEIPNSHKDTIDWTTLMSCYTRNGLPTDALNLFLLMREQEGIRPDEVTFVCLFNACSRLGDLVLGSQGHVCMIKEGLPFTVTVNNAAMDLYVKCGQMRDARVLFNDMKDPSVVSWTIILTGVIKWEGVKNGRNLFDEMPERNEVAWTVIIVGYIENGLPKEAFNILSLMVLSHGLELNNVTLCSILSACSQTGDLFMGRWIHVYVLKMMEKDMHLMVGTSLIDMYSKCGRVDRACKVFENMSNRNVVAWNAMLSGLSMHGEGSAVLKLFSQMINEVRPDDITFVSVLNSCSHSGLVDQGCHYFRDLEKIYNIRPKIEHYACMVDLLGRAGRIEEAEILVREMPIRPNEVVLGSLLASCGLHGKLHLGEKLLQELIQINPLNTEYHILLSNMFALAGKQEDANSIRRVLKDRGIRKIPGTSSIHINGEVHQFSAGDKSHPLIQDVYVKLDEMIRRLRSVGYIPNTASQMLFGSEIGIDNEEEREQALFYHSEKLAISFGLISTKPGVPLHIFKNLRICNDCHSAVKLISTIYDRKIVIRDRSRFHCFKQGSCSCSDYW